MRPKPMMSGATTLNPISRSVGIWLRQPMERSGHPLDSDGTVSVALTWRRVSTPRNVVFREEFSQGICLHSKNCGPNKKRWTLILRTESFSTSQ